MDSPPIEIFDRLSLRTPKEEREALIREILSHYQQYDLTMFILPLYRQDCWDTCAELLSRLPDEAFLKLLPNILEWYQDLNWPGIAKIERRIFSFPEHLVLPKCKDVYERALKEKDTEWAYNLESVFGPEVKAQAT